MAVPSAPAAPVVVDVAARTATATWAHPTGSNPPILDYRLQLSTRSNFSVVTSTVSGITGGSSGVSFDMWGMQRATNYWVRVQARNADGYGDWSNGGAFTTLPEVPGAPRSLSQVLSPSSEYAHDRVKVKWSAPSSNGGGEITGYDVQASTSSGFGSIAASWSGNALTAQLTGLSYGRGYFVRVRAKNSAGNGDWVVSSSQPQYQFATSYEAPATPTSLVVSRVSDSQQSLSWNLTTSTSAPVHRVRVQRWDSAGSTWTPVALLTGAATSWVDGGTVPGREYQYRVLAENDFAARVKQSAYSSVVTVFTSPVAPLSAVARKTVSEAIEVTITRATSGYVTDFEVQHRADGGAWVTLGTTAGVTYTHPSPDLSKTQQYRVRAVKGELGSDWVETNVVSLAAPPLAPTGLRLEGENTHGGNSFLGRTTFDLVWDFNAGPDTAGQTEFEAEITRAHQTVWQLLASGGAETRTTLDDWGGTGGLLFRVRTKGTTSAGWGDWSDTFHASEFPFAEKPAILSPETTVTEVPFYVRWDLGAVADYQSRVRVDVYQGDTQVDSVTVTPSAGALQSGVDMSTPLVGGESYEIRVTQSRSGGIFWSETAAVTVTADFPVPPAPAVEAYWEPETATAVITAVVPDPVGEEVPASSVRIQRRTDNGPWALIGEVAPGHQVRDTTAPLSDTLEYRGVSISHVPSSLAGPETSLEWVHAPGGCPIFVSGGQGFSTTVTAAGMGEHSHTVNTVLHQFEGRTKPVPVFGPEESWEVNYSGVLLPDTSTRKDWRDLINLKQLVCYRDCRGRRIFGVIPGIKISPANGADWLQFTVTETSQVPAKPSANDSNIERVDQTGGAGLPPIGAEGDVLTTVSGKWAAAPPAGGAGGMFLATVVAEPADFVDGLAVIPVAGLPEVFQAEPADYVSAVVWAGAKIWVSAGVPGALVLEAETAPTEPMNVSVMWWAVAPTQTIVTADLTGGLSAVVPVMGLGLRPAIVAPVSYADSVVWANAGVRVYLDSVDAVRLEAVRTASEVLSLEVTIF